MLIVAGGPQIAASSGAIPSVGRDEWGKKLALHCSKFDAWETESSTEVPLCLDHRIAES